MLYICYRMALIGLPKLALACQGFIEPIMLVAIIFIGMLILFGALGMHISSNLGSTLIGGLMRGAGRLISFVGRQLVSFVVWLFTRLIPGIYRRAYRFYNDGGVSDGGSIALAVITTVVAVAVII